MNQVTALNMKLITDLYANPIEWDTDSTLTHWGREKMAAILQMTFLNAFSWMKTC